MPSGAHLWAFIVPGWASVCPSGRDVAQTRPRIIFKLLAEWPSCDQSQTLAGHLALGAAWSGEARWRDIIFFQGALFSKHSEEWEFSCLVLVIDIQWERFCF